MDIIIAHLTPSLASLVPPLSISWRGELFINEGFFPFSISDGEGDKRG
jgi:hypothetical protein